MAGELLRIKLKALRAAVDACIAEAAPPPEWRPREYSVEGVVPPGSVSTFMFGKERVVPETMVFGLPETADTAFGMEYPFFFEKLIVEDEDAPHFGIQSIFVGARATWGFQSKEVPAAKFLAGGDVRFNKDVEQGLIISMIVHNDSKVEQRIRAKIVGREQVPVVDERESA